MHRFSHFLLLMDWKENRTRDASCGRTVRLHCDGVPILFAGKFLTRSGLIRDEQKGNCIVVRDNIISPRFNLVRMML